jgi:hypothetical protein
MREQPLPPDFYDYVSDHYARLRRDTIVTKPDNRPDLSMIRTALLSNAAARVESVCACDERVARKIGTSAGSEAYDITGLDAARASRGACGAPSCCGALSFSGGALSFGGGGFSCWLACIQPGIRTNELSRWLTSQTPPSAMTPARKTWGSVCTSTASRPANAANIAAPASSSSRSPVKRPEHGGQDQHQQYLLPDWPFRPWHGHQLADLVDREGPDQLDEMEDCSDPLLQEFQELVEDLLHGRDSVVRTIFKASSVNAPSCVVFRSWNYRLRRCGAAVTSPARD